MARNIQNKTVKRKQDTSASVFFHGWLETEMSPLDDWAVRQLAELPRWGWRLSRFHKDGVYHLLGPCTGEA